MGEEGSEEREKGVVRGRKEGGSSHISKCRLNLCGCTWTQSHKWSQLAKIYSLV